MSKAESTTLAEVIRTHYLKKVRGPGLWKRMGVRWWNLRFNLGWRILPGAFKSVACHRNQVEAQARWHTELDAPL